MQARSFRQLGEYFILKKYYDCLQYDRVFRWIERDALQPDGNTALGPLQTTKAVYERCLNPHREKCAKCPFTTDTRELLGAD